MTEISESAQKDMRIEYLLERIEEQEGRIMKYEQLAKDLYFAYINKDPDCPHEFEIKAVEKYQAQLGGAEDGSSKD